MSADMSPYCSAHDGWLIMKLCMYFVCICGIDCVTKNQIDYITINNRFRNAVQQSKSYPGADCGSDHNPVICKLKVRLKKLKMIKREQQLDYCQLQNNQDIKNIYAIEVKNRFSVLEQEGNNTTWEVFKEALVETAKETIPKKTKQSKNKWMTEEILRMMRRRQAIPQRNSDEYKQLHREIRKKCREAKEEWLKNECAEIEKGKETDSKAMHKRIKDLTGAKTCSSSGCIRSKDGTIITEKDDILERWTEYIEELFRDNRGGKPEIRKNIDGPKILQSEIRAAVSRMKGNKARGPDGIVIEMIKALDDFGIEKLTIMANEIYDTGKIPQDLSKSIFIALPKKPGTIECELHRTISLMSHVTKVILRVIMMRARRCTKPEISQEQCGFVEDTGTRNAIFIVRTLCERAIEVQHDLYLCFIDYAKAFDKVKHEDLFEFLQNLDIDGKDLRLIRNLYWEQSAAIRIDGNIGKYTQIRRGVRQGCVFSPDLFNLYSENILRDLNDIKGCIVGGYNLNNVRYADDAVLIAGSESELQELLNTVVDASLRRGLSINIKKTQCMVISKSKITPTCHIHINNETIKQVEKFKYLGSTITSDGRNDAEIKIRIGMAKDAFQKMEKVIKNKNITIETRNRILQCYVIPILTYGSECWTISPNMERKLEAAEMWFHRRMLHISWKDHVTNDEVLRRGRTERKLMNRIRAGQMSFLGHIMRKHGLENIVVTGKIEGERSRGRPRLNFMKSLSQLLNISEVEIIERTRNREEWKTMTANVRIGYGT